MISKPNFYILGAAKSGTTSLWHYLNQHPEVFMSDPKEPNFMAFKDQKLPPFLGPCNEDYLLRNIYNNTIVQSDAYEKLFQDSNDKPVVGEASVRYFYFSDAIKNIKEYTPNAKFVLVLRNPVDRLYSHYCMMRRYALEPLLLEDALEEEENRIAKNWGWDWHYKNVGKYGEQLEQYFDVFDKSQFKIIFYEDFKLNTLKCMDEVFDFLGVSDQVKLSVKESKNVGYLPKNYNYHKWIKDDRNRDLLKKVLPTKLFYKGTQILDSLNRKHIPSIDETLKNDMMEYFRNDILKLETLLQRKTNWIV